MKKVLVIYYTQSGQLGEVARSIASPLEAANDIEVAYECLKPVTPFPFPWPALQFFDTFPETVHDDPQPILPLTDAAQGEFDLIILAFQVWFLSPAQPITAFLQSQDAARLLNDTPVITVIACRNMWLMAQEKMKAQLLELNARLVDNVVMTDPAQTATTFFSTPMWVLTGNKGPFLNGLIPEAGVSVQDIAGAAKFGDAIVAQLPSRDPADNSPLLEGLGAVSINENLIASERIAIRSFKIWGAALRFLGKPGSLLRRLFLIIYILFLVAMILTVVPITSLLKRLSSPLMRQRTKRQRLYYAAPSGEASDKVSSSS